MITNINRRLVSDQQQVNIGQQIDIIVEYTITVNAQTTIDVEFSSGSVIGIISPTSFRDTIPAGQHSVPHELTIVGLSAGMTILDLTIFEGGVANSVKPLTFINTTSIASNTLLSLVDNNGTSIFNNIREVRGILKDQGFNFNKSTKLWEL